MTSLVDCDPAHYVFDDFTKYCFMVNDLIGSKNGTRDGYIVIINEYNAVLAHVLKINPMSLKKLMFYVQEAIPVRLKGIHLINTGAIMDIAMNMLRPFLNKETAHLVRKMFGMVGNSLENTLTTYVGTTYKRNLSKHKYLI